MSNYDDYEEEVKSPRSKSPLMGVTGLLREQGKSSSQPQHDDERRTSAGGILRLDPNKPRRRSSTASVELRNLDDPSSPCPSDRLSVTWADGEKSISSEASNTFRGKIEPLSENPSLLTLRPASNQTTPPDEVFAPAKEFLEEPKVDEDFEASVSMILQRSSSTRVSKLKRPRKKSRRFSSFTNSSEGSVKDAEVEEANEKVKVYNEVLSGIKLQPWPIKKKLHLARLAREYLAKQEGEIEERLAHSTYTKDVLLRNFMHVKKFVYLSVTTIYYWMIGVELWQERIKRIESHFGSAVASYFIFLRWVMGLNLVIALLLSAFVIIPETLAGDWGGSGERKLMLDQEKHSAFNLKILWDFEGILRYSPVFYGFYGKTKATPQGYRLPLAYILTLMCVYGYSFVAILRKMAANSRLSKLGDSDETVFTFRLFTGWDYTIGNMEAAQNKVASINMGFRESLLEAREADREITNWKSTARRCLAHFLILCLLLGSAYAVVLLVERSNEVDSSSSWWRQNELTVILSLISIIYPSLFELVGLLERNHPRKQLQWQLARIMILNLLNLYTLIFALFGKVDSMSTDLCNFKEELEKPEFLQSILTQPPTLMSAGLGSLNATLGFTLTAAMTSITLSGIKSATDSPESTTPKIETTETLDGINVLFDVKPGCRQVRIACSKDDKNQTESENSSASSLLKPTLPSIGEEIRHLTSTLELPSKDYLDFNLNVDSLYDNPNSTFSSVFSTLESMENATEISSTKMNVLNGSQIPKLQQLSESTKSPLTGTSSPGTSKLDFTTSTPTAAVTRPDISGFAPGPLRPFLSLFSDNNNTDDWGRLKRSLESNFTSEVENEKVDKIILKEKNYSANAAVEGSIMNQNNFSINFSSDPYYEINSTTIPDDYDGLVENSTTLELDDSATPENSLTYIENVTQLFTETYQQDLTTFNNTYNTDEYPNYIDGSIGSDQDCFIIIEVCNETDVNTTDAVTIDVKTADAVTTNDTDESVGWNETQYSYTFPSEVASTSSTPTTLNHEILVESLSSKNRTKLRRLCWETMFGQEIIKLTVMDLMLTVLTIVIGDYIRAVIVRIFNNCCWWDLEKQFPGYPDFKIAENILHLVNNQGLVWMGMFFSPGLPVINLVKLLLILYVRSWAVTTSNVPPETVFKASNNNNFYLALLLIMLFLCTLPVGYAVVWVTPSWHCGPFSDYGKIYQLSTETLINSLPKWCEPIIDYISSPGVVIPGGLLLILIIYYLVSLTTALREAVQDLKDQLRTERNAEKHKAQKARSDSGHETPNTKWGRLIQLTPGIERKAKPANSTEPENDDKSPLIENEHREISSIPDDITDLGQSEVFDDSVMSDSKKGLKSKSRAKTKDSRRNEEGKKSHRRESLEEKRRRGSKESSSGTLTKSPSRKKNKHRSDVEEVTSMMSPSHHDSPKSSDCNKESPNRKPNKQSLKSREGYRRSSNDSLKHSYRRQSVSGSDRRGSSPKVEIEKLSKEYPELGDPFEYKQQRIKKQRKTRASSDKEDVPVKSQLGSKHKRDPPILGMTDLINTGKKRESKKQKKEDIISETPEMHTIPIIKISKEDSVERSIQQAKLERQPKMEDKEIPPHTHDRPAYIETNIDDPDIIVTPSGIMESKKEIEDRAVTSADLEIDADTLKEYKEIEKFLEVEGSNTFANEDSSPERSQPHYRNRKPPKLRLPRAAIAKPEDDDDEDYQLLGDSTD